MKPYTYALLAAAAACGLAAAETAYTTPVGYVTEDMPANAAKLVGLTVHSPTVFAGVLDAESSGSVTDNEANFTTALTSGSTYVLELPNGTIQEVTAWTATSLTTPDDIQAFVTPGTTQYKIRKAPTIADVFGANNSAGLTATPTGNAGTYDEILVLNAAGTAFLSCFYYDDGSFTAWYDSNFNEVATKPLVYADAFYIRRIAGTNKTLTIAGEVKTTPTTLTILPGNTFMGTVNPVGTTLGNSGLAAFLDPDNGTPGDAFDKILIQQPNGAYVSYNYYNDGSFTSWYDSNFNDATNIPLGSGVVVQSQTLTPKNATINAQAISN